MSWKMVRKTMSTRITFIPRGETSASRDEHQQDEGGGRPRVYRPALWETVDQNTCSSERDHRRARQQEISPETVAVEPGDHQRNQKRHPNGQDHASVDPNEDPGAHGAYSSGGSQAAVSRTGEREKKFGCLLLVAPERRGQKNQNRKELQAAE